jgi:RIO kinase 1
MHRSQGRDHIEQIDQLVDQGFVDEVIGLIKTGKEASVYCCTTGPAIDSDLVAVKVYRGQQYRFKNDAVYQESRAREMGLRGRALRAFENRRDSAMGREVQSGTWRHHEFATMQEMYNAGADVPKPIAAAGAAIAIEYFGDEEEAAQQLNRVRLRPEEAGPLFKRIMNNVELFLACNRVHGDLSPHNILYFDGQLRVIDFPQSVDPRFNRNARDLLERDVANVCRYFTEYGVEANSDLITHDLWRRFTYGLL